MCINNLINSNAYKLIMDLKLKDEVTKLLIETPGLSVSELAKKTNNYYSYTHKLLKQMEKNNLVNIKKKKKGKKVITYCELKPEYKQKWVNSFKRILKAVFKDAEVKASIILMYFFLLLNNQPNPERMLSLAEETVINSGEQAITQSIDYKTILLIVIPILLIIWYVRKRRKQIKQ